MPPTQDGSSYGVDGRRAGTAPPKRRAGEPSACALRSLATGGGRFAHAGGSRYDGPRVAIPSFALSEADSEQLERTREASARRCASVPLHRVVRAERHFAECRLRISAAASVRTKSCFSALTSTAGISARARWTMPRAPRSSLPPRSSSLRHPASRSEPCAWCLYRVRRGSTARQSCVGWRNVSARIPLRDRVTSLAGESDFGADRVYSVSLPAGALTSPFGVTLTRVLAPISVVPSTVPPGQGGADVGPLADLGVPVFVLNQDGTKVFRPPSHRQRHAGQDRSGGAVAERGGLGCAHLARRGQRRGLSRAAAGGAGQ